MAVTETWAVAQSVPNSGTARPPQPVQGQPQTAVAGSAADVVPKAPPTFRPPVFAVGLHYDRDLQRLILEARDPVSGFVVFQMPRKYVGGRRASNEVALGTSVNQAV